MRQLTIELPNNHKIVFDETKMVAVESSNIQTIGCFDLYYSNVHDKFLNVLVVNFKKKPLTYYAYVMDKQLGDLFHEWKSAESAGKFLREKIIPNATATYFFSFSENINEI